MTHSLPPRPQGWTEGAARGCTENRCGSQDTSQLCGCHGRRCNEHAVHELTVREA